LIKRRAEAINATTSRSPQPKRANTGHRTTSARSNSGTQRQQQVVNRPANKHQLFRGKPLQREPCRRHQPCYKSSQSTPRSKPLTVEQTSEQQQAISKQSSDSNKPSTVEQTRHQPFRSTPTLPRSAPAARATAATSDSSNKPSPAEAIAQPSTSSHTASHRRAASTAKLLTLPR
jgi:hypothetical protein